MHIHISYINTHTHINIYMHKMQFFPSNSHINTATWMLTRFMKKKLDGNYTRMLRSALNKSWRQHPIKQLLYGHLPPITRTIQIKRTRHAEHCWRSKDKLISDILLWTPSHGWAKAGRPAKTYIQQFCADTGYRLKDQPGAMDDRDR